MQPEVAIIGAGLAGLTLARVLADGDVSVRVYERDSASRSRAQGGSLDLHPETGQRALAAAGLMDEFRRHARPQGEEVRILDPAGTEHVHHVGSPAKSADRGTTDAAMPGRPEIDRAALREVLNASVDRSLVRWDRKFISARHRPGGGFFVSFADGQTEECDVLIGADGANSRTRPLLTPVTPTESGITYAELWLRDLDIDHPELSALIGNGSLWCLGSSLNVGAQRIGAGHARVSVMMRDDPAGPPRLASGSGVTKSDLMTLLNDWDRTITALIEAADDSITVRSFTTLPVDLRWTSQPDVALIGDAAHLMPPVGEGANHAMLDAAELGRSLLDHPGNPAQAIRCAEEAMFHRIRPVAEESGRIQDAFLSPNALAIMTAMFTGGSAEPG